jgi:hypothetical protein
LRNNQRNLDSINLDLQANARDRLFLQQERITLNGGAGMQNMQLQGTKQDIERAKRITDLKAKKAEKAKASVGGKALSREAEARAFSTYDEFPLDELRERILATLP